MRHHPLTPMTDPNLVRVLARQTPHPVGLLAARRRSRRRGRRAARLEDARRDGVRHVVVDATDDADLDAVAAAARATAAAHRRRRASRRAAPRLPPPAAAASRAGRADLPPVQASSLAGSCSRATLGQVAARAPTGSRRYRLDPAATPDPATCWPSAHGLAASHLGRGPC